MRPRSRRLLVFLSGLGICTAGLSAFRAGLLSSSFALPPEAANRAPDTKVTLCTQVRLHQLPAAQLVLYRFYDFATIFIWLRPCSMQHVVCAGPQRYAVPGEHEMCLASARPEETTMLHPLSTAEPQLNMRSPSRHASMRYVVTQGACCTPLRAMLWPPQCVSPIVHMAGRIHRVHEAHGHRAVHHLRREKRR